jgi:hypothetical protein
LDCISIASIEVSGYLFRNLLQGIIAGICQLGSAFRTTRDEGYGEVKIAHPAADHFHDFAV